MNMNKRRLLLATTLIFTVLLLPRASATPAGTWTTKAPIPTAVEGYGAASVGNVFFYIAGFHLGDTVLNQAYDSTTDTWSGKAPLPDIPRAETVAVATGGFVYLIGGRPVSLVGNQLWRYDPSTDTWASLAPMPTARATEHMAAVTGSRIFVAGGRTSDAPCSPAGCFGPLGSLATLEIYDISSNTWSTGAPMPAARSDAVVVQQDSKIFVFGGFDSTSTFTATTFIYDIPSNTWTTGAPLPGPLSDPAGGICGNKIHVIGGYNPAFQTTNLEYDPVTNAWSVSTPIPLPTVEIQGVSLGGRIFVVGGGVFGSGSFNPVNQVFKCA